VPPVNDISAWIEHWPVATVSVGVTTAEETIAMAGDVRWSTRVASVTKLLTAYAGLVALEEETISLDDRAGPAGSTVRHLLAHASGLSFDESRLVAAPGSRRVYSNVGIEVFAEHLESSAGMQFADYLRAGVLDPLGMHSSVLRGSPAHALDSTVEDLLSFCREVMRPMLIDPVTRNDAIRPHFSELRGVVPGVGSFQPNTWGLGFEIRDHKRPHWTGVTNSPETFGHFGGSGCFLWIDPVAGLGCVGLTDRGFGAWSMEAWTPFSDAVLAAFGSINEMGRTTL
jgi:CubicO group peptidase (beta-lactamase class C family)